MHQVISLLFPKNPLEFHLGTMARWTKTIMIESLGVSNTYSRSTSTSVATHAGMAIVDVLRKGNSTNAILFLNIILKKS